MAYYAKISETNLVEQVIVASPEIIQTYEGVWAETFIDDPTIKYAGIGMGWDGTNFIPQPLPQSKWNGNQWITPYELGIVNNAIPIITVDGLRTVKVFITSEKNTDEIININGEPLSVVTDELGYYEFELSSDTAGLITITWKEFILEVAAI